MSPGAPSVGYGIASLLDAAHTFSYAEGRTHQVSNGFEYHAAFDVTE